MKHDRIVFWQGNPSPHQAPWIRALADISSAQMVTGVFNDDLTRHRLDLGWHPPDYGKAQVLISPDRPTIERLVSGYPERTVHVFSGGHNAKLNSAIRKALSAGSLVGILSEGRDWRRLTGLLRQGHSIFNERSLQDKISFVLALGNLAARWYGMCGYVEEQIFPFCYVVDSVETAPRNRPKASKVTLSFVGQLIKRKRVDLLLYALSKIEAKHWLLRVIGDGKERHSLEKLVRRLGLDGMVYFTGILDNTTARCELTKSDIFVLPSQWDGWGAVVNEAMMSGVPVICSDHCGAGDLIHNGFNGEQFRCDSLESLTNVLERWVSKGPLSETKREQIRTWSRCIEGEAVARYFLEIIEYIENGSGRRPEAPWIAGMPADHQTFLQAD
ncbi:MAG: glycosyltransferase [Syntrophobacteraceae bacterium]